MSRPVSIFAAAAGLALLTAPALAGDIVRFGAPGQQVVGALRLPQGDPAPNPAVLLLHGFTGSRDELATRHVPAGLFAHTAERLAAAGYASLRIDFRGSGDSTDLDFAAADFDSQITDALAALDFLRARPEVDAGRIAVIGYSQGGLVAATMAGRQHGQIAALALWNAVGNPRATYAGLLGADTLRRGLTAAPDQPVTASAGPGVGLVLNGGFFHGVATLDPVAEIAGFTGPLFVAQGQRDSAVAPEVAPRFIAAHDGPEELWQADMDHVFDSLRGSDKLEATIAETIGFLDRHLN